MFGDKGETKDKVMAGEGKERHFLGQRNMSGFKDSR